MGQGGYWALFRNRHFDGPTAERRREMNTSLYDMLSEGAVTVQLIGRNREYLLPLTQGTASDILMLTEVHTAITAQAIPAALSIVPIGLTAD